MTGPSRTSGSGGAPGRTPGRPAAGGAVGRPASVGGGHSSATAGAPRTGMGARTGSGSRPRAGGPTRSASGRTPASRPAPASRGRTAAGPPERTSKAWVRGAVLVTILVVLAVTLAPTARSLLRQRGDLAALQEKVVQQQQSVTDLQREQARWADPAYVEQQARERLKFVKVGDRSYSVIDPATELPKPPASAVVAAPKADANAPWYGQVWQSMRLADQPSAGMAPVPDK